MFATNMTEHLIRSNLWSGKIKEFFEADLMGMRYVDWITDFPDGDVLNIPSIGQAEVHNFAEGQKAIYNSMDTGNFTFSITDYLQSGMYITEKMKQDSMYAGRLTSMFVPKMRRAINTRMEVDMLSIAPEGQTASSLNTINGAAHRWVASGTNETIDLTDFAKAKYALQKAHVPAVGLTAIVDPSVEYKLNTLAGFLDVSNNPAFNGMVNTGFAPNNLRFIRNIYGFDVYVSDYLKDVNESINGKTAAAGKANLFFSAAPDALPFVGAVRQQPKVDSDYNKDEQREEYVVTARYGFGLYRPEAVCVVISDTDQVTF